MSIKVNGRINWKENPQLLRIVYSIMKYYMIENDHINIPCQQNKEEVIMCAKVLSMITGEEITSGQVGAQLWLQADRGSFTKGNFRNIKMAIETELLCENNFSEEILEPNTRMIMNKYNIVEEEETSNV